MSAAHSLSLTHEQGDTLLDALGLAADADPDSAERYGAVASYVLGRFDEDHRSPEARLESLEARAAVRDTEDAHEAHTAIKDIVRDPSLPIEERRAAFRAHNRLTRGA